MEPLLTFAAKGGPVGLAVFVVTLVVVSLVRGWLIPRSTHKEITALQDKAYAALEATVAEQKKQIAIMLGRQEPL